MITELNRAAREATERAVTKWMLVHGTHPDSRAVVMLSVVECGTGRAVATGCGENELIACNALLGDLTERCRGLIGVRRMAKVWRGKLRGDAGEIRAEKSKAFFAHEAEFKKSPSPENEKSPDAGEKGKADE